MGNLRFLLLALLFAGVAQIKSNETEAEMPDEDPELFKELPEIAPRVEMRYLPGLFLPEEPARNAGFKGKLLSSKDGCGISKLGAPRIVGGTPAKNGAYPWMALLGYKHGQQISFNCGGSLITTRHVLTAAHCLNHMLYMVRLGEHDYRTETDGDHDDVRVVRQVPHVRYDKSLMINDIAILHLNRDVHFNERIKPVCLPIEGAVARQSFVGKNPFVAGWGTTRENGNVSPLLLHVQVPVISNSECRESYRKLGILRDQSQFSSYVICAGHKFGGSDSCQGDSGGPLMLPVQENGKFPFYQIGVVSYGIGCARPNIPGVYANVQHYGDWIKQNVY